MEAPRRAPEERPLRLPRFFSAAAPLTLHLRDDVPAEVVDDA